jgi:nitrogen fixation/metabolism regulation signal transduction histidine kinase
MRLKAMFRILTLLLLAIPALMACFAFHASAFHAFFATEVLICIAAIYLFVFYRQIIKPLQIIGDGMDLLKEQDFSSRLRRVGQADADRIIEIFNKMMNQLKNERLHLREQHHLLDLLINASPLGVIILHPDETIRSVNPATHKIFGLKHSENICEKPLNRIGSPLAAELARIKKYDSQIIRLPDTRIYKCTHSSFIDRGVPHSFHLIEPLTEEVFKAEKKAYEKVIRMIAHEVNNTIAGITSTLDTLQHTFSETATPAEEEICEVLRVAIERCYGMNRFITNFADVIRIPEPQPQEKDLNQLVVSGKRFMENTCRERNIQIVTALSEPSPRVNIDGMLFEQALVNIIKNAADAIGNDGTICIRTTNHPVCLEIADTGKGIDRTTEARLFSPFFSTKPNGQGLGLLFVREVFNKHGYAFSLQTDADGLTRFRIRM